MKWSVGMTPGRARDRMGPEEFLDRLAVRLVPKLATPGEAVRRSPQSRGRGKQ
jgi:hypothetical protein